MGGTGADTAESARNNLGLDATTVAKETCVPITKGGTGLTSVISNSFIISDE
jgi:hypothetical protein